MFLAGVLEREKLIGFWKLNGENQMITCSITAGDAGFLSSLKRLLVTVSLLSLVIVMSDPHLQIRWNGKAFKL